MQEVYNNYEDPIKAMKALTEQGKTFSFSHKKINGCVSVIRKAQLRPMAKTEKDAYAKYKLQYTNIETNEPRCCYIPLLISFNGKKIVVSK